MKILLAVDGSAYTKRMLAYIAAHPELLGPAHEYTAFTVVPRIPPRAADYLEHKIVEDYYQEQAEEVLGPVKAFAAQQGWQLRALHVAGHAGDEIAALAAKEHFDLVVMGTHGRSTLGGVVLGSVTTRVVAHCKQPVLLIR
ncbi:universal stress protein [Aquabacterium sp.]|uniref:universal stress protein n=1 Tax=Aquabacterium sp. TaxID=1872578 RepID=UPI003784E5D9